MKRKKDGGKGRGEMAECYFDRHLAKVKLIVVSSRLPSWREFSFNILALVCVKIHFALSHPFSDYEEGSSPPFFSEERGKEENWSGEVGHAV